MGIAGQRKQPANGRARPACRGGRGRKPDTAPARAAWWLWRASGSRRARGGGRPRRVSCRTGLRAGPLQTHSTQDGQEALNSSGKRKSREADAEMRQRPASAHERPANERPPRRRRPGRAPEQRVPQTCAPAKPMPHCEHSAPFVATSTISAASSPADSASRNRSSGHP